MTRDYSDLSRLIAGLGREHKRDGLELSDLDPNPFMQFGRWLDDALESGILLPNAMTLATAGGDGLPSGRMVLLKGFDEQGFVFYTNYASRKAQQLAENPNAALVFYWPTLDRQVGVTGGVAKVERSESEEYFKSRPLGSRFGAWASRQSEVIGGREELDQRLSELQARHPEGDVPLPDNWGGYRLVPIAIEFWQSRPNRLHDRFNYRREPLDRWVIERLSP